MSDVKFISIRGAADQIAKSSTAAYWDDRRADFHAIHIHRAFADLADQPGYEIKRMADEVEK